MGDESCRLLMDLASFHCGPGAQKLPEEEGLGWMDAPAAHAAEAEDDGDAGAEEVILLLALVVEEAELPTAKNPSSLQHHGS